MIGIDGNHVNTAGELCEYCKDLPSNPFVQMKKSADKVFYNNIPFYRYPRGTCIPQLLESELVKFAY